jgi:membrane associated rhomboid family serine protease
MIPLRDNVRSRTKPFVNVTMIVICAVVFFAQLSQREGDPSLVERYGMIPVRVTDPEAPVAIVEQEIVRTPLGDRVREVSRPAAPAGVPAWLTVLTCIFLHGGWMHFLGNMWFLWIFGDNVEDRFGHLGYLVFYLACGAAASLTHLVTDPSSSIPTIGASGAIAGVMGSYFLLYPKAMVLTAVPIFYFIEMLVLPAWVFLGIWFLIQFVQGSAAIGVETAGVAWWAHIGGFAAGFVVALALRHAHRLRPPVDDVLPHTEHAGHYRLGR